MDNNCILKLIELFNKPEPVIIFDLDLTVIGHIPDNLLDINNQQFKNLIYKGINIGFVRPYFKEFVKTIHELNIPIIFYTASNKEWAIPILNAIEKHIGHPFIFKVFTSKYCNLKNQIKFKLKAIKSISYIQKCLNKSRLSLNLDNSILLDDNYTLHKSESNHHIKIQPYNFVLKNSKSNTLKHNNHINDNLFFEMNKYIEFLIKNKNIYVNPQNFTYKSTKTIKTDIKKKRKSYSRVRIIK